MSVSNFVSEKEIEEERKRRQEEWDRVRQPGQPEEPPEPQDNRPLYDRLKQQRDQKQLEFEESHKLKNMLRGLDSEEAGFLDYVDQIRKEEEDKRRKEELALLSEVKKHVAESVMDPVDVAKLNELTRKPVHTATSKTRERSKQAQLIAGALKKRKNGDDPPDPEGHSEEKKLKSSSAGVDQKPADGSTLPIVHPSATVLAGVRLSATKRLGVLPGLDTYDGASSDDSSNSSSDTDNDTNCMLYTNPVQVKLEKEQQKQAESSTRNC